jgi:hypothetical protein
MIGNLVGRSEQTENEAVQQTDLRTCRTPARLAFANHMNRFVTGFVPFCVIPDLCFASCFEPEVILRAVGWNQESG